MRIILFIILSLLMAGICTYWAIPINDDVISTLYNTIGIFFSIGMGLIVTFSLSGIENDSYIRIINKTINKIRDKFIFTFSICTISYIVSKTIQLTTFTIYSYDICIKTFICNFTLVFFIFSIIYLVLNFIAVQRLKDEIFYRLLEEKRNK